MGLRSWFTQVNNFDDFKKVVESIKENPNSYGLCYFLKLDKKVYPFRENNLLIAWAGDGNWSRDELTTKRFIQDTVVLDNLNKKFREKPYLYGDIIEKEESVTSDLFDGICD